MKLKLLMMVAALLMWATFCACETDATVETVVVKAIGPEGGTILGPKGVNLVVPRGALAETVEISISELLAEEIFPLRVESGNGEVLPLISYQRLSIGLKLAPMDLQFDVPVTIELPYDSTNLTLSQQSTQIRAYGAKPWSPIWTPLEGIAETNQHIMLVDTSALGNFALYLVPAEDVIADGDADSDGDDDTNCTCQDLAGEFCAENTDCAFNVLKIATAADMCAAEISVLDSGSNTLGAFTLQMCDTEIDVQVDLGDYTDCLLKTEDGETWTLDCLGCLQEFSQAACGNSGK